MMNSIDVSLNYSCEKFVEREKKREKIHDQTNSASWTQPSLSPSKNPVEQYWLIFSPFGSSSTSSIHERKYES